MTAGRRDWIIICQLRSLSTTVTQYEWLEAFLNKESDMKWQFENESDMGQIYYMTRTRFPKTLPELELMMDSLDLWTTPRNYYYGVTHLSPVPRFFIDTMKRYYDEKGKGEVLLNKEHELYQTENTFTLKGKYETVKHQIAPILADIAKTIGYVPTPFVAFKFVKKDTKSKYFWWDSATGSFEVKDSSSGFPYLDNSEINHVLNDEGLFAAGVVNEVVFPPTLDIFLENAESDRDGFVYDKKEKRWFSCPALEENDFQDNYEESPSTMGNRYALWLVDKEKEIVIGYSDEKWEDQIKAFAQEL